MSELVDLLHDYVDQYDRVSLDLERMQQGFDRLRGDVLAAQAANRDLLKECASLKASQPAYRTKHDYVLLRLVVEKCETALRAVNLREQGAATVGLVEDALYAIAKL